MVGQVISHYQIVEKLDGGGMGVVYKAKDLRLNRFVALKFLAADLTRNSDANARFRREAEAASALDHPNICTIHEIDETADGELFLTMAYYDGETLKQRLARGPLSTREAVDVGVQIARGLSRAHASGIVHRDIKPANVMIGPDGLLKILDFGIAKLAGHSDLTGTGTTVGTIAYMSPEQIRGAEVGPSGDVWAMGVVLYELLSGRHPFGGKDDPELVGKILDQSPAPLAPALGDLDPIVRRALSKKAAERFANSQEVLDALLPVQSALTAPKPAVQVSKASTSRRMVAAAGLAALAAVVALAIWTYRSSTREERARDEGLPRLQELIGRDEHAAAFALALELERDLPNDRTLAALWPQFSVPASVVSDPAGAEVFVQPYAETTARWQSLGRTPLDRVRLPRSRFRFRIEKEGYQSLLLALNNPSPLLGNAAPPGTRATPAVLHLRAEGESPEMVWVAGGIYPVGLATFGVDRATQVDEFLIDRFEVTNADYRKFVLGGGYAKREFWGGLASPDVVSRFTDATDRQGPATWEVGGFPDGQDQWPVGGVSWYEAAAYCRSVGKTLPTLFHWARAALPYEIGAPIAPAIIPASNFAGKGPAAVGTFSAVGSFGTFDMAGNLREWTWNEGSDGRRWSLGGAWNDPTYMFALPTALPPLDRSPSNGFRCARYTTANAATSQSARVPTFARDNRAAKPVSDEIFQVFLRQFAYVPSALNARVEETDATSADWTRETITFDTGYEAGRTTAYLFLPKTAAPPYQLVVLFPGIGAFAGRASSSALQPGAFGDYMVKSGRALVYPVYAGSFERWSPLILDGQAGVRQSRTRMLEWRHDVGHVLDVLTARPDIDTDRIAYLGVSYGTSAAFPLVVLEKRFKTAVLGPAGFSYREVPPETDALNYLPRATIPVLMMGGRHDYLFPLQSSQIPMFERLGTKPENKRQVIFDAGHANFPRNQVIREGLAWLDNHLGPVNGIANAKP